MKKEWIIIGLLIIIIILIIIPMFNLYGIKLKHNNLNSNNPGIKPVNLNNNPNDCYTQLKELERLMSSYNYCDINSDCIKKDLGILDFCSGHLINKNVNLDDFNNKLTKYQEDKCNEPIDDCIDADHELECVNKKCVYKIVTGTVTQCTSEADCKPGYKCYYESPTTLRNGTPGTVNKPGMCIKIYENIQE